MPAAFGKGSGIAGHGDGTYLLWGYWSYITARPLALTGDVNAGCAPAFPQERKGVRRDRTASFQTTIASARSSCVVCQDGARTRGASSARRRKSRTAP